MRRRETGCLGRGQTCVMPDMFVRELATEEIRNAGLEIGSALRGKLG